MAVVAISPNDPAAVRLDELGYTDLGDSFEDMKIRASDHKFAYPYLYDGETQATAKAYGVLATPHVFIFDADRKLRYVGRFDDSEVKTVKSHDASNAVDALLAGKPVPVETTRVFGCSTKWADKQADARKSLAKWDAEPVTLEPIDDAGVAKLAKNDDQEAARGQPLGDLVRPLRRRAARARHHEPDVPRPAVPARHDQPGRSREEGRGPAGPQGEPRRGDQLHPQVERPRRLRRGPRQGMARPGSLHAAHRAGGKVLYRKTGAIDPLEVKRADRGLPRSDLLTRDLVRACTTINRS